MDYVRLNRQVILTDREVIKHRMNAGILWHSPTSADRDPDEESHSAECTLNQSDSQPSVEYQMTAVSKLAYGFTAGHWEMVYTVNHKKHYILFWIITLANLNRFL